MEEINRKKENENKTLHTSFHSYIESSPKWLYLSLADWTGTFSDSFSFLRCIPLKDTLSVNSITSTLASRAMHENMPNLQKRGKKKVDCSITWCIHEVKYLFLSFKIGPMIESVFVHFFAQFSCRCVSRLFSFRQHFILVQWKPRKEKKKSQSLRLQIKYVTIAIINRKLQYMYEFHARWQPKCNGILTVTWHFILCQSILFVDSWRFREFQFRFLFTCFNGKIHRFTVFSSHESF